MGGIKFRLDALLLQTLSIGDGLQILITDLIGVDALLLLGKSLCLKSLDIGILFSLNALSFSLLVGEALFFSKFDLLSCRLLLNKESKCEYKQKSAGVSHMCGGHSSE